MDMQTYVALLSLDVWAAGAGRAHAPLPPLGEAADHGHDVFLGPLKGRLEPQVPGAAREALLAFPGEHVVEQRISDARVATGWLAECVMIGAEHNESGLLSSWEQYVPATLHWPGGWLIARSRAASHARARPGALEVEWSPASPDDALSVRLHAPGLDSAGVEGDTWDLPGLRVRVEAGALEREVRPRPDGAHVRFRARSGGAHRLVLRADPA
jgi:hypothetical protein